MFFFFVKVYVWHPIYSQDCDYINFERFLEHVRMPNKHDSLRPLGVLCTAQTLLGVVHMQHTHPYSLSRCPITVGPHEVLQPLFSSNLSTETPQSGLFPNGESLK